jgi:hypothetical protein
MSENYISESGSVEEDEEKKFTNRSPAVPMDAKLT